MMAFETKISRCGVVVATPTGARFVELRLVRVVGPRSSMTTAIYGLAELRGE
jgi:hypothetical protein